MRSSRSSKQLILFPIYPTRKEWERSSFGAQALWGILFGLQVTGCVLAALLMLRYAFDS